MQPTNEQIERLWSWCGLSIKEHIISDTGIDRISMTCLTAPDGTRLETGYPSLTLDNLFKWAVPKLEHWHLQKTHNDFRPEIVFAAVQLSLGGRFSNYWGDDSALALFWAILEVIEKP